MIVAFDYDLDYDFVDDLDVNATDGNVLNLMVLICIAVDYCLNCDGADGALAPV